MTRSTSRRRWVSARTDATARALPSRAIGELLDVLGADELTRACTRELSSGQQPIAREWRLRHES